VSIDWLEVATSMRAVMLEGGSRVIDHPAGGYIQWADAPDGRLHVEASDGGEYTTPMARHVVEALEAAGWAPPDSQMRNCWFQVTEEVDVRQAVSLVQAAWSVLDRSASRVTSRPSPRGRVGAAARESIAAAEAVLALVSAGVDGRRRLAAAVRPAWDRLVAQTVREQLASLDVDTIRRFGPSGMRMAALRKAGARSVLDIYESHERQLETVPGVGQFTAQAAKATASAIGSELARSFKLRQLDARSRDHQPIVSAVCVALRASDILAQHDDGVQAVRARFPDLVEAARPATGRFSFWLAGRDGKARALAALDELELALQWVEASGLAAAMQQAVALSERGVDIRRAMEDYWRRPDEYHAVVAGLPGWAGPRPTGGEATPDSDAALDSPRRRAVGRAGAGQPPWAQVDEPEPVSSPLDQQNPPPPEPEPGPEPEDGGNRSLPLEPPHVDGGGHVEVEPEPPAPQVQLPLAGMVAVAVTSGSRQKALAESGFTVDQVRSLVETMVERPGHSLSVPEAAVQLGVSQAEVPACVNQLKKVLNAPGVIGISFDRVSHVVVLDPGLVERALQEGAE
jgi:hypothetical protein